MTDTTSPGPPATIPQRVARGPAGLPPAPPTTGRGFGIASLATGIVSVVFAVVVGFIAGALAIILGIVGLKRRAGRSLSIAGIVTGAIGMSLSVVLVIALVAYFASTRNGSTDAQSPSRDTVEFQNLSTPCYEFDGPSNFINNLSDDRIAACFTKLQLWGEKTEDGQILPTGAGEVFGTVNVEAVSTEFVDESAPDGDLADFQAFLESDYLLESGQSITDTMATTLDGTPAIVTYLVPNSDLTQLRVVITVMPQRSHSAGDQEIGAFLITVSTEESNGEQILDRLVESWTWK
ncbi:MAG TPA: DUF4190 domain-containing protein [Rhodoglobus sp.]|nr:DUF4190 domain-containing protein [Rhodoglobus sp.]HQG70293.1 DUF4190 domain-containing protein [Rhodoglobus sp.]